MRMNRMFVLLGLCWLILIGCDEDADDNPPPPDWLGSMTMSIGTDTLWYLPGDSASTIITVTLWDFNGIPLRGERVEFSYDNSLLGYIEYADTILLNRTNSYGQLEVMFTCTGRSGKIRFASRVDGLIAKDSLVCVMRRSNIIESIELQMAPDTVWYADADSASMPITVVVTDTDGLPMEGQHVNVDLDNPLLGSLEYLNHELQDTTDANGRIELLFTTGGVEGDAVFSAANDTMKTAATVACRMLPNIITVELSVGIYWYWNGEVYDYVQSRIFWIEYLNAKGIPLEGRQLTVTTTTGHFAEEIRLTDDYGIIVGYVIEPWDADEICIIATDGIVEGSDCSPTWR